MVAALAAIAMLGGLGYVTTSSAIAEDDQNPSGDTSTLQPANSKSIAKIEGGDGDQYALHLTASGDSSSSTVTTAVPADIVLVLDKSGSMKNSNRDTNAKNAATALASKLLTAANAALPAEQQVQMAVVTFSDRREQLRSSRLPWRYRHGRQCVAKWRNQLGRRPENSERSVVGTFRCAEAYRLPV